MIWTSDELIALLKQMGSDFLTVELNGEEHLIKYGMRKPTHGIDNPTSHICLVLSEEIK